MMGELLTTMVANDAFTQALTNPLLARNVFNEATFSAVGMRIINETTSLQQILRQELRSARDACSPASSADRGRRKRQSSRRSDGPAGELVA